MKETTIIYGLSSTRDLSNIRYVGKTANFIRVRLSSHVRNAKYNKTYKDHWILKEIKDGFKIKITPIDEVYTSDWEFWEIYWIFEYRRRGYRLTNTQSGGHLTNNERSVVVLTFEGKYVETYSSIAQSSVRTKVGIKTVENILRESHYAKSLYGYQFIYKDIYDSSKDYDLTIYYYRYSRDFEYIAKYKKDEIPKEFNSESMLTSISRRRAYKNCVWSNMRLSRILFNEYTINKCLSHSTEYYKAKRVEKSLKPKWIASDAYVKTIQCDNDNNFIKEYPTISSASQEFNAKKCIQKVIDKPNLSYKGFRWYRESTYNNLFK